MIILTVPSQDGMSASCGPLGGKRRQILQYNTIQEAQLLLRSSRSYLACLFTVSNGSLLLMFFVLMHDFRIRSLCGVVLDAKALAVGVGVEWSTEHFLFTCRDGVLEEWPRPRGHLDDKILWPWP